MEENIEKPYTPDEQKVADALIAVHKLYLMLPEQHSADIDEWVEGIHKLQHCMIIRVVRRDYPKTFIKNIKPL